MTEKELFNETKCKTVKGIREIIGLTQKEFANKFNIPIKTLQNWEYGRSAPADYVLQMILTIIDLERKPSGKCEAGYCEFNLDGQCVLGKSEDDCEELYD